MLEKIKAFKALAERAAGLEQTEKWEWASYYWEQAAERAKNRHNLEWATCRAERCRRRLEPRT